jgi:hypothetical protein
MGREKRKREREGGREKKDWDGSYNKSRAPETRSKKLEWMVNGWP